MDYSYFGGMGDRFITAIINLIVSTLIGMLICSKIAKSSYPNRETAASCLAVPLFFSLILFFIHVFLNVHIISILYVLIPPVLAVTFMALMGTLSRHENTWKYFDSGFLRLVKLFGSFGMLQHEQAQDNLGQGTHGSARWGGLHDAASKGHIEPPIPAFTLGRLNDDRTPKDNRFRFMGHIITCAPTGSGKGIGSVIPNLLEYPGSCLVLDLKGENYAVTARRRQELGNLAVKIDPFGVIDGPCSRYNLLDPISLDNEDCISQSNALAGNMVMQDKAGEMGHWDESATNLIQGLILYVKTTDQDNLAEVRRLLTTSQDELDEVFANMSISDDAFGIIARAANAIISKPEKERASIISTAQRHTAFLDDPRIAKTLAASDFDLQAIKSDLISCYMILPPTKLAQNARFIRLLIGSVLEAMTSSEKKPPCNVAFLLDEFAQLGYMPQIESAISLLRGYGTSFLLYVQDLSQLKSVYAKWQSFLANSAKVFYGTSDIDTAKYISQSLGVKTIEQQSVSKSSGIGVFTKRPNSQSDSTSETGRALLTPDEVMRLGPESPLVLIAGEPPYMLRRLNYLDDGEYNGLFDPNPYHS